MDAVSQIYVEWMRRLSASPNPHATAHAFVDEQCLHVFDAGKRPVIAALLAIATVIQGQRNV